MSTSTIDPYINRKVIVLHQDDSAQRAARAMCDNRVGCVLVSDHDGHVVGIVTDRDLVCSLLAYSSEAGVPLSELMTENPVCVSETATIQEVVSIMETNGLRRVPVVHHAAQGRTRCVGLVTLDDLIASQSVELGALSGIVKKQVARRRQFRARSTRPEPDREQARLERDRELTRFHRLIGERTGLDRELVASVSAYLLSALVQRLHYTGAAHLISQLPRDLQSELLDLPAGPDRSISAATILNAMVIRFNMTSEAAHSTLSGFCKALREIIDPKELRHFKDQLPLDLKVFFNAGEGPERQPRAA